MLIYTFLSFVFEAMTRNMIYWLLNMIYWLLFADDILIKRSELEVSNYHKIDNT